MGLFIEMTSSSITFEKRLTPLQNKLQNIHFTLKNILQVFNVVVFTVDVKFLTSLYSMGFFIDTPSIQNITLSKYFYYCNA